MTLAERAHELANKILEQRPAPAAAGFYELVRAALPIYDLLLEALYQVDQEARAAVHQVVVREARGSAPETAAANRTAGGSFEEKVRALFPGGVGLGACLFQAVPEFVTVRLASGNLLCLSGCDRSVMLQELTAIAQALVPAAPGPAQAEPALLRQALPDRPDLW